MKEFIANRLSSGNRIFPDKVTIEDNGISVRVPSLFSGKEKMLLYHEINSVETVNPLVGFSSVKFRTRNYDTVECKGFSKEDTDEIKKLVNIGINSSRNTRYSNSYQNDSVNNGIDTAIADLEKERLNMDKQKRREERADMLRQQGRPFHALIVEYQDAANTIAAILIMVLFIVIVNIFIKK